MPCCLAQLLLLASVTPSEAAGGGLTRLAAREDSLELTLSGLKGRSVRLIELRPYETYDPATRQPVVWQGVVRGNALSVPRFDGKRDRLYSKLQAADANTNATLGSPRYVTDLSGLPSRGFDFPWPKSIKGLQVQMVDDAVALGVKHAALNVMLAPIVDWSGKSEETWEVDGEHIPINLGYIAQLDAQIKPMSDGGMSVTAILLNGVPSEPDPNNPFIHPRTDLANAPNHLGAFNTTDERGLRYYRAAVEYLARRYSDPQKAHGWVSGYIIGNEVQAHWDWYNIGRISVQDFVKDYGIALRVADLAARRFHPGIRTYVSLEHHWNIGYRPEPEMGFRGKEFLELLSEWAKAEGDFPWEVAFHPYPENLFEPRTWRDRQAILDFLTPKITFRNIEVLPAFLRRKPFLYEGRLRHIILSEQGFHTPDGPDGQAIQAAGYAYAYYRISHTPGIEAFILHRHVDHRQEFGLKLGLWTWKDDDPAPSTPGRKKLIYDVFRLADTDQWEPAFEFAKPIVGIRSWNEVLPAKRIGVSGIVPRPGSNPVSLAHDLYLQLGEAKAENCLDVRPDALDHEGESQLSIFHHPTGKGPADLTYELALPAVSQARKLMLRFATAFSGPTEDGARFAVLLDGEEVWSSVQREPPPVDQAVDLTRWAGRTVRLTLRVDALGNERHDWAHWVRPQILAERRGDR